MKRYLDQKIIPQSFYNRPTLEVARDLLGKILLRRYRNTIYGGIITETEAYCGPNDKASHAHRGRTKRTEIMFGPPGYWYVYLVYGMYYCLNIVTEKTDYPAAVLIRAIKPFGRALINTKTDGPGKLCRAMHITGTLNNTSGFTLSAQSSLWIEDTGLLISDQSIKQLPRIGINYAGNYKNKPWRFLLNLLE